MSPTTITRLLFVLTLVAGSTLVTLTARGAGEPPLPLIPIPESPAKTVSPSIPAPMAPTGQHIRLHGLTPGQEKAGGVEKPGNGDKNGTESGPELALGDCIAIALTNQPTLKAAKASLGATQAGYNALMNFGTMGTIISPDLSIRKQQAQSGLAAACSDYQKAYNEVVQDVTRMYFTAIYARQQGALTDEVVEEFQSLIDLAWRILKETTNPKDLEGLTADKIRGMELALMEVEKRRAEQGIGEHQAMDALRQVMAVDEKCFPFRLKETELPVMAQQVPITKEQVVELALCRRPELSLAAAGVDAFRLEVYAQGKVPFKRIVPTLASGADLHSKDIPQAMRGKEYRPGGILPEMPPSLVGSKLDRVTRAMSFSERAEAVYESARGLITLEAENAYWEFELANKTLGIAKREFDKAIELQKSVQAFGQNTKAKDQIAQAEVMVAKSKASYIEAVYKHLLALAALERITAGGIKPAFPGR